MLSLLGVAAERSPAARRRRRRTLARPPVCRSAHLRCEAAHGRVARAPVCRARRRRHRPRRRASHDRAGAARGGGVDGASSRAVRLDDRREGRPPPRRGDGREPARPARGRRAARRGRTRRARAPSGSPARFRERRAHRAARASQPPSRGASRTARRRSLRFADGRRPRRAGAGGRCRARPHPCRLGRVPAPARTLGGLPRRFGGRASSGPPHARRRAHRRRRCRPARLAPRSGRRRAGRVSRRGSRSCRLALCRARRSSVGFASTRARSRAQRRRRRVRPPAPRRRASCGACRRPRARGAACRAGLDPWPRPGCTCRCQAPRLASKRLARPGRRRRRLRDRGRAPRSVPPHTGGTPALREQQCSVADARPRACAATGAEECRDHPGERRPVGRGALGTMDGGLSRSATAGISPSSCCSSDGQPKRTRRSAASSRVQTSR